MFVKINFLLRDTKLVNSAVHVESSQAHAVGGLIFWGGYIGSGGRL